MQKNEILALIERVKEVCPPECKIEIVPMSRPDDVNLVVVRFSEGDIAAAGQTAGEINWQNERLKSFFERNPILKSVYVWENQRIHNLHYEKIIPLLNDTEHFRVVYFCGDKFVFYAYMFGCFECDIDVINYVGIRLNDQEEYMYIGIRDCDLMIEYLMTTSATL